MINLKPCPFCGGAAKIKKYSQCLAQAYSVVCKDVTCRGGGAKPLRDIKNAIDSWNRRATDGQYRKQKEGEWKYPPYAPFGGSYVMKRCSICGYKPDFDSDNPYTKFCPNCGASMKGGAE